MNAAITWMVRNPVAANLFLGMLIVAGVAGSTAVNKEIFPQFSLDAVEIQVEYPGASPTDVEDSIIRLIEQQVEGIDGIQQITSVAAESYGTVRLEVARGFEVSDKLEEIKIEIDRIATFPAAAEEINVREVTNRFPVAEIALYGDVSVKTLKDMAYRVRDDLAELAEISFVEVSGVGDDEISIEVSNEILRAYNLTLPELANTIATESSDLPGGKIRTTEQELAIRTLGKRQDRYDFAQIPIFPDRDGGREKRLAEIATIVDGIEETDVVQKFNDESVIFVKVYKTGDENVLDVAQAAIRYVDQELQSTLPPQIGAVVWRNYVTDFENRIDVLVENGVKGFLLVLLALTLFLELRLAWWVAAGIGVSFVAAFSLMAVADTSLNNISAFGFILALGIVVDDAIVVGESIYASRSPQLSAQDAAIRGTRKIHVPVIFAVFTTIAGFMPLLFIPGSIGNLSEDIPKIVIAILFLSLLESLFILPRHLAYAAKERVVHARSKIYGFIRRLQSATNTFLTRFVDGSLESALRVATRHWGATIVCSVSALILALGLLVAGHLKFGFFPDIESDVVTASIELAGTANVDKTYAIAEQVATAGQNVAAEIEARLSLDFPAIQSIYIVAGEQNQRGSPVGAGIQTAQSNKASVFLELWPPEQRSFSAKYFEQQWREEVGELPGVRQLDFSSQFIDFGEPVQIEISGRSEPELARAADAIKDWLRQFRGVYDVFDDQDLGQPELRVSLRPRARSYGLTLDNVASQVRSAFFGAEALRVTRGREEVTVYVRLPQSERNTISDLSSYRIKAPSGKLIPLGEVASIVRGQGPSEIIRRNGRRIVTVSASIDAQEITTRQIQTEFRTGFLEELQGRMPSLAFEFAGEQREQQDVIPTFARNFGLAMIAIYILLALPFRSYTQPLVIMAAIPFSLIGIVIGHILMGLSVTIISLIGAVGLSGVIINSALVLVHAANDRRREGTEIRLALIYAAKSRFRPVFLTAITTFLGIFPLMMEQSVKGQFLVPLAVSIGFGVLFGTAISIILVPALAMARERLVGRLSRYTA
ncbi:MAG: efflux RND transporter permease subunit [Gammaproteobacteria bacterium]|nr:efflux RND transporter permease subunit [Gammaproteobacteria bacterium]